MKTQPTNKKKAIVRIFFLMLALCFSFSANATKWYASPTGTGDGSIGNPFNLQTAFYSTNIKPGDSLLLRSGTFPNNTYKGRFICELAGTAGKKITVMSYPGEWAVLNGNILPATSLERQVLKVKSNYVIFRDFEITYKDVIRSSSSPNFSVCSGIFQDEGKDCEYINLSIHDNPGIGMENWKEAEATLVYGCLIYNNGYITPATSTRPRGPGLYLQNRKDSYKIFKNNIVFNNFWVGFEAYSDERFASFAYLKNMTFDDNTVFNNGIPASVSCVGATCYGSINMQIGSLDTTGNNTISNINVINNTCYYNTLYYAPAVNGGPDNQYESPSLDIGNRDSAHPSQNILIDNNFLSGRNPAVKIQDIETLTFTNNYVLGRFLEIRLSNDTASRINPTGWHFDHNKYYTAGDSYVAINGAVGHKVFRLQDDTGMDDYYLPHNYALYNLSYPSPPFPIPTWRNRFPWLDVNSSYSLFMMYFNTIWPYNGTNINFVNPPNILKITQNIYKPNQFKVVLHNPPTTLAATGPFPAISVDFSDYGIPAGTPYTIKDIENYPTIASSGSTIGSGSTVSFQTDLTAIKVPEGTDYTNRTQKTHGNFGVFLIEFASFSGCEANKLVTANVITGNFDFQQASVSITASNKFDDASLGLYHAGSSVILKDGFHAVEGSTLRAYISGCTQTYSARIINPENNTEQKTQGLNSEEQNQDAEQAFKIYPNPSSGIFTLESLNTNEIIEISITRVSDQKNIFQNIHQNVKKTEIDISKEPQGLFTVQTLMRNGKSYSKTIIKN